MKYFIVFFAILIVSVQVVKAEDKSWYEIDGIRIRLGQLTFGTNFLWDESGGPRGNRIIHTESFYSATTFPL